MITLKHYTLEEALAGVRQDMDPSTNEPLYMLKDVRENLGLRYTYNATRYLPPDALGWLRVPVRPGAARRGTVTGNGVTQRGVELMVARANRRPAFMRYDIPWRELYGYARPAATALTLRYDPSRRTWLVGIRRDDDTWHTEQVRSRKSITDEEAVKSIAEALVRQRMTATTALIFQAAEPRTGGSSPRRATRRHARMRVENDPASDPRMENS
jgi:hypothetical protein